MKIRTGTALPRVDAVIFDMDGLMLDTERVAIETFRQVIPEFGLPEADEIFRSAIGRNRRDTKQLFLEALGPQFPFDVVWDRWLQYYDETIAEFGVPWKPGLENLIETLDGLNLPKAVATSTTRANATGLLEQVNLLRHFKIIVGGDEVTTGKPHPEIFLTAAERLSVEPMHCVVFEDSPAGVRAAHAAGMIPILVPDLVSPPPDVLALAFRVLPSLEDAVELFTA